jgi:NADPH:quinone reductase
MRAVHCVHNGEPRDLRVVDIPEPTPGPGEVLVAVEAAGLGYADGLQIRGGYQVKRPLPFIPGGELAGRVIAAGPDIDGVWVGRSILGMARAGSLAERVAMPVSVCTVRPAKLSAEAAAGMIVNYGTAQRGMEVIGEVQTGETVLILGAAGGVGLAGIDVAKALGATVIAAASSAKKLVVCAAQGADMGVDYSQPDWRKSVEAALGGKPLNVAYDPVGGPYSEIAFRCLAPGGRLLVVGFASGEIPRIPLNLPLLKRASIVGVDWGGHHRAHPEARSPEMARLMEWVEAGKIHPQATAVYPLEEAGHVLQALLEHRNVGKPVIQIGS